MLSCCPVMTVMTPVTASSSQQYSAGRGDVKLNLHLSCSRHPGHLHTVDTLLFSGDDIDCSMSPSPPPAILRTNIFITTTNNIVHHFGQFHNIFYVERSARSWYFSHFLVCTFALSLCGLLWAFTLQTRQWLSPSPSASTDSEWLHNIPTSDHHHFSLLTVPVKVLTFATTIGTSRLHFR